jgi:hypothetical protein
MWMVYVILGYTIVNRPLSYEVVACPFYARQVDKFEDTKVAIRSRKSKKDRQNNG